MSNAVFYEYELLEPLGRGGYAEVWKVKHIELGYIRALKILEVFINDTEGPKYKNFIKECKVLLRLGNGAHEHIVRIAQPKLFGDRAMVEMEYIGGTDLQKYIVDDCRGFMPYAEVKNLLFGISSALAYCHYDVFKFCYDPNVDGVREMYSNGSFKITPKKEYELVEKYKVIHNDIHSNNIRRRSYNGNYVLLDFGLSLNQDAGINSSSRKNGDPKYKSPEKWDDISGTLLTEQSDIYSFGVLMYEALAGTVPFVGNSKDFDYEIMQKHKFSFPSEIEPKRKAAFEKLNAGVQWVKDYPDWLDAVIMKCLEKRPEDRYRNGKELYDEISKHLDEAAPGQPSQETQELIRQLQIARQALAEEKNKVVTVEPPRVFGPVIQNNDARLRRSNGVKTAFIVLCVILLAALAYAGLQLNAGQKKLDESNGELADIREVYDKLINDLAAGGINMGDGKLYVGDKDANNLPAGNGKEYVYGKAVDPKSHKEKPYSRLIYEGAWASGKKQGYGKYYIYPQPGGDSSKSGSFSGSFHNDNGSAVSVDGAFTDNAERTGKPGTYSIFGNEWNIVQIEIASQEQQGTSATTEATTGTVSADPTQRQTGEAGTTDRGGVGGVAGEEHQGQKPKPSRSMYASKDIDPPPTPDNYADRANFEINRAYENIRTLIRDGKIYSKYDLEKLFEDTRNTLSSLRSSEIIHNKDMRASDAVKKATTSRQQQQASSFEAKCEELRRLFSNTPRKNKQEPGSN